MTEDVKTVSMHDTKREILREHAKLKAAYEAALAKVADRPVPFVEVEAQAELERIHESLPEDPNDIVQRIATLRGSLGATINQMGAQMESLVQDIVDARKAREAEERELARVVGIQGQARALEALLLAETAERERIEAEHAKLESDFRADLERRKVEVTRNTEQWRYDFQIQKRDARGQLEQELAAARKECGVEIEDRLRDVAAKETEYQEAMQRAADAEESLTALVEEHSKELQRQTAIAASAAKREVEHKAALDAAAAATREAELRVGNEGLRRQIEDLVGEVDRLRGQVDAGYAAVANTANQALDRSQLSEAVGTMQETLRQIGSANGQSRSR